MDRLAAENVACNGEYPVLGLQSMRRVIPIFVSLFLLVHAIVPALPSFACAAMEGTRLTHPCCPADDPPEAPAWTPRCCQRVPVVKLDTQREPTARHRLSLPDSQPMARLAPPLPFLRGAPGPAAGPDRPPDRPSPPSKRILRI